MTTIEIGPFRLIDPPGDQGEIIAEAIRNIEFPWIALQPVVEKDYDKAVMVEWGDTGQGVSGLFYGGSIKILLSTKTYHLDKGAGFVFAHEVGHLIDRAVLDDRARKEIIHLMHQPPYLQIGHFNHDHPDAGHETELWANGSDAYVSRIYECFADQFVAAFAPKVWSGEFMEGAPKKWPRFSHWTEEHEKIRGIIAEAVERQNLIPNPTPHEDNQMKPRPKGEPMFKDVGRKHPRRKYIEWAVKNGYMDALGAKGKVFRPRRSVSRAELAEVIYKMRHRSER